VERSGGSVTASNGCVGWDWEECAVSRPRISLACSWFKNRLNCKCGKILTHFDLGMRIGILVSARVRVHSLNNVPYPAWNLESRCV
jgi:hypothetical protein